MLALMDFNAEFHEEQTGYAFMGTQKIKAFTQVLPQILVSNIRGYCWCIYFEK